MCNVARMTCDIGWFLSCFVVMHAMRSVTDMQCYILTCVTIGADMCIAERHCDV